MKKIFNLLLLLVLSTGLWIESALAQPEDLPALKRGVNLSHWLQYEGRQPMTAADFLTIRQAGFDHVRLPFDPLFLKWNPEVFSTTPNDQPALDFTPLDHAIEWAAQADLAIILDFHPSSSLRERIESEAGAQEAFVDFWGRLAERYAHQPVSRVGFELLNEPQYYQDGGTAQWNLLQQRALSRVRQAAPEHLILLSGIYGGSLEGLQKITPVMDQRVRYVFHFYQPMLFTHLNAPWEPFLSGPYGMISGLVYPAKNVLNQVRLLDNADPSIAWAAINQYIRERWGAARIERMMNQTQKWAARRNMALICTEFGALRHGPDPESRQRWLQDTRSALEAKGIGWTVWDYADLFGVAVATGEVSVTEDHVTLPLDPQNPQRQFEQTALQALGLTETP